jgi:hypothetical protein
LFKQE